MTERVNWEWANNAVVHVARLRGYQDLDPTTERPRADWRPLNADDAGAAAELRRRVAVLRKDLQIPPDDLRFQLLDGFVAGLGGA
jgi:hypothetical protein